VSARLLGAAHFWGLTPPAPGVIFSNYASAPIDDGKTGKRMPNHGKEACPFAQDSEPTGAGTAPPSPGRKVKKAESGNRHPLGSDKVGSAVLDASVYLTNRQETAARLVSARTANSVGAGVFKYDAPAAAAEEEEA
jgi:hypothetical protein